MADYCDSFHFSERNRDHYEMVPNDNDTYQFWQGLRGPVFVPHVNVETGYISWTNNANLPNPEPVKIVGKDGRGIQLKGYANSVADLPEEAEEGDCWAVGEEDPLEAYAWFDGWCDLGVMFPAGQDGVSPTVTMTAITGGTRLTITDIDHPGGQSTDIMNGSPGNPGQDGVSPAVSMEAITGGTRLTITDKDHPSGQSTDIMNGTAGQGVPAGGTAGQVLQKSSSTDYATEWHSPNAGDTSYSDQTAYAAGTVGAALTEHGTAIGNLKSDIGIVEDGNTCTHSGGISEGQYVIWKGQLFIASTAIAEGATLASGTNLTPKTDGGLNDLRNTLNHLEDGLAIPQSGDNCSYDNPNGLPAGSFIHLTGHSILPDGFYYAANAISYGAAFSNSNLTAQADPQKGALNTIYNYIKSIFNITTNEYSSISINTSAKTVKEFTAVTDTVVVMTYKARATASFDIWVTNNTTNVSEAVGDSYGGGGYYYLSGTLICVVTAGTKLEIKSISATSTSMDITLTSNVSFS